MIGVLSKPAEAAAVEEFFELFKTPWEPYRPDRSYDVVLATVDDVPAIPARLLLVFSSNATSIDEPNAIVVGAGRVETSLDFRGTRLPVYGHVAAVERHGNGGAAPDRPLRTTGGRAVSLTVESNSRSTIIRVGYDLFDEVALLISGGQPAAHSQIPTLDRHVAIVRDFIVAAHLPLLEIPAVPAGHKFSVCLTHDIDFVGIRDHKFDHSMWGFVYRSTVGAVRDVMRGRSSIRRMLERWRAVASLPFVFLGWAKDFWSPFEWYLRVERNLGATYFVIPFKRRAGQNVPGRHASRRATAYDVGDIPQWTTTLARSGCELGVHGIDAWHNVDSGRQERERIDDAARTACAGIRMHWLLWNGETPRVLEAAGYQYDSTAGYNETVGYRNGTGQVFRPSGATTLLELPLHIQDGALFYPGQLDLTEQEAERRCDAVIDHARKTGGVVTVLWHDRSHGPERFWGGFYEQLIARLKQHNPWFGTAGEVVRWFRQRRQVRFERAGARAVPRFTGGEISPPLTIRLHNPSVATSSSPSRRHTFLDFTWNGRSASLPAILAAEHAALTL